MTQELKPCPNPSCAEHLEPVYDDPHESNGRLLYYSHLDDTGCLFDDFMLLTGYEDQWQALPRHNEPEWLPIETAPKDKRILLSDGKNIFPGRWVNPEDLEFEDFEPDSPVWCEETLYATGYDKYYVEIKQPTHWMPLPNPPEVMT